MRARLQEQWHHDKQLVIYRRPDPKGAGGAKPVWYYDIKLPNQERIRQQSTKFTDYTDALLYAEQQYRNLSARAATGIKLHAWTFQRIANQAIQYYRDQLEAEMLHPLRFERFERTVKKCLNPYFGDLGKDFVSINTIDIEDWIVWRKRKGKQSTVSTKHIKHGDWIEGSKVATGTLNYELQMLRMVYDYARKKELILPAQIPEIKSLREDQREKRRPHITKPEWDKISNYLRHHYIKEIPPNLGNLAPIYEFYRNLHRELWILLWETGARVGEISHLKWGDIEERKVKLEDGSEVPRLVLRLNGKVGLRHSVAQPYCKTVFERWKAFCQEKGLTTDDGDFVFRHPPITNQKGKAGKPIGTTNQSFQGVLRRLDLLPPKGQRKSTKHKMGLSVYSLRHGAITRDLVKGMSITALSKNVGVSIPTLTKFYDHAISTDFIDEITRFDIYGTDAKFLAASED